MSTIITVYNSFFLAWGEGFSLFTDRTTNPAIGVKDTAKTQLHQFGLGCPGISDTHPPSPSPRREGKRERERLREKHHLRVRAKKRSGKPNRPTSRIPILSRRACLENVKRVKTQLENQFVGWVCGGEGLLCDIGVDTIQRPKAKAKCFGLRQNQKTTWLWHASHYKSTSNTMDPPNEEQDRWGNQEVDGEASGQGEDLENSRKRAACRLRKGRIKL